MSEASIARANFAALVAWAAILLVVSGLTWDRVVELRAGNRWIQHTDQAIVTIKDLQISIAHVDAGERGYLLTGDPASLAPYEESLGSVGALQEQLQRLTADNPSQQNRLNKLASLLQHRLEFAAKTVQLRRDGGLEAALGLIRSRTDRGDMLRIDDLVQGMSVEEQKLLAERLATNARRRAWFGVFALGIALLMVVVLAWAGRMINAAWSKATQMERQQRTLAEYLRASLDSLSQGVAVFDASRHLTNWNPCFTTLLRLPDTALRRGMPYASLAGQCGAAAERDLLESEEQLLRAGALVRGEVVSYERTRADGQSLELRRTGMTSGGFVLTISDMTKRIQAEAVLREAQKMQAIGQLTGGIAHDFNNLLTVILGNLELAQKKLPENHFLQARIGRAVWASQRGATLTSQLLAFARKQPLAPAPLDLAKTVPELVPLLQRTLGAPIEVRFVGAAGLWPALADAAQLENALLNLSLNARDAMPGGGRLTLELANKVLDDDYARQQAEVTAGDYVMLAVSDTGHGMSPEVIARAFEPFYTTKPEGKGTGLGLAMVFGFVKQSKGHVKIYSEVGEGTSIKIYLPRAIGGLSAASVRTVAPLPLARGDATVLIVEDEAGVREIAASILRDYGYQVLEAADGEEAMRLFGAHTNDIDLLLSDVVLPGKLRGRDVAERITAMRPQVKILFMSGYTENSIVHHGRLDDGVKLIGKPFKREQLAAKVAELLTVTMAPPAAANDRSGL